MADTDAIGSREVLNIKQASEFLTLAPRTLYQYSSEKRIPHLKVGKRLLFRRADLDRWLDARLVPAE